MNHTNIVRKTLLALLVAASGGCVQLHGAIALPYVMKVASYFKHKEVPADCNEGRLNELILHGDYGQLSAYIDAAMQSGDGVVQTMVATWMNEYSAIEIPLLMYKTSRNVVSDARTLASAGRGMRSGSREDVLPPLIMLIKFCLYYYIDSVICLRSVARIPERQVQGNGCIESYVKELSEKAPEILNRVHQKWQELMIAQGAREDYFTQVYEAIRVQWQDKTYKAGSLFSGVADAPVLRERLHGAPWVFGVKREVHWGTTAHRAASHVLGGWLAAGEPGGIIFGTPDDVYHQRLGLIPDKEFLRWYNNLRAVALAELEKYATVTAFFENFSISRMLAIEADKLQKAKKGRAHAGGGASGVAREEDEEGVFGCDDGSVTAAGSDGSSDDGDYYEEAGGLHLSPGLLAELSGGAHGGAGAAGGGSAGPAGAGAGAAGPGGRAHSVHSAPVATTGSPVVTSDFVHRRLSDRSAPRGRGMEVYPALPASSLDLAGLGADGGVHERDEEAGEGEGLVEVNLAHDTGAPDVAGGAGAVGLALSPLAAPEDVFVGVLVSDATAQHHDSSGASVAHSRRSKAGSRRSGRSAGRGRGVVLAGQGPQGAPSPILHATPDAAPLVVPAPGTGGGKKKGKGRK